MLNVVKCLSKGHSYNIYLQKHLPLTSKEPKLPYTVVSFQLQIFYKPAMNKTIILGHCWFERPIAKNL